ncbi:methyltransferase domain-containing protein, partial [Pelagibacteraceae bacterium]|nr:methyltransferase domain-containing protein [Pelagibacteraceae bacterium]
MIHNILYEIYILGITIDNAFKKIDNKKISQRDIDFINNVSLNSMRYYIHSKKILLKYVKKRPKIHEEILLCCAITQIVFLDFKEYAVINSSVEVSKKLKLFHGFINACLRKISKNKNELKKIKISYEDLPLWFKQKTQNLSQKQIKIFLENFHDEPNLHLVFKNKKFLLNFEEKILKTSEISGFLIERKRVEMISSFNRGEWWVQDFSSSFPLNNIENSIIDKSCFDVCAAPGGKSFQILSKNKKIILNDKSKRRIEILKKNLNRLNFNPLVTNLDINTLNTKQKYDFIILDAPCSAIGTIRKNPEIFYRKQQPNLKKIIQTQRKMLLSASKLLKENGIILYMVCSFLKEETTDQINYFLDNNKNFNLRNFSLKDKYSSNSFLIQDKAMFTLP